MCCVPESVEYEDEQNLITNRLSMILLFPGTVLSLRFKPSSKFTYSNIIVILR